MIQTTDELSAILQGTPLEGHQILPLDVPGSEDRVLVVEVDGRDLIDAWKVCRERLDDTGRWPVATLCWFGSGDWASGVAEAQLLSRFEFENELGAEDGRDLSPAALISRAKKASFLEGLERSAARALSYQSFEEAIENALPEVEDRVGRAPAATEIEELRASGQIDSYGAFQRWLLGWEAENLPEDVSEVLGDRYLQWFSTRGETSALLLLPTPRSWETLAYLHFFGAGSTGSEPAIALLHSWYDRFGAELVAHFGTMLQFFVQRPPAGLKDALTLAWEQECFAECTTITAGIPLIHHARVLVGRNRWFLHERP